MPLWMKLYYFAWLRTRLQKSSNVPVLIITAEVRPNDAAGPLTAPNRNFFGMLAVRVDCCLTNNAYFVYWRSHSARNDKNPNHFQVVAQPNSRTYDASGGQTSSVLASIWFCKDLGQDHFVKFATTTSLRCPTLENDVWETHLGFLQLKPKRQ